MKYQISHETHTPQSLVSHTQNTHTSHTLSHTLSHCLSINSLHLSHILSFTHTLSYTHAHAHTHVRVRTHARKNDTHTHTHTHRGSSKQDSTPDQPASLPVPTMAHCLSSRQVRVSEPVLISVIYASLHPFSKYATFISSPQRFLMFLNPPDFTRDFEVCISKRQLDAIQNFKFSIVLF